MELTIPADLPPVYVDAGLIVQLFSNLFDNIAKYTPSGTHATIGAAAEGSSSVLWSRTGGRASRRATLRSCSTKFQRGSEEGAVAGAGLGLAICRAITRAHGGEIEARRRDRWRRAFRHHVAREGAAGVTEAMHQVLVIEDEPDIRHVLKVLLEAERYRVIEADTALRAEIEARSHKPDLLMVDLGLPDGDGLTVIRRVRAWSPVPIVVLSARTMEEQKIAALDAGADDYVTKPFSAPELLARVRAALRRNPRGAARASVLKFGASSSTLRSARRAAGGRAPSDPPRISRVGLSRPTSGLHRHPGAAHPRGLGPGACR